VDRAPGGLSWIRRKDHTVKPGIHPEYHEVTAHCACGATWQTRSTKKDVHLDICSNCHPFFTGRQKLIDTEGRVDRFNKKFGAQTSEALKAAAKAKKAAKAAKPS
jgi:large subunit ribosomal protein L31